jgi:hypothetical protein
MAIENALPRDRNAHPAIEKALAAIENAHRVVIAKILRKSPHFASFFPKAGARSGQRRWLPLVL